MGICVNCGNNYDNSFRIEMNDRVYEFDSFECAIQQLAPTCHHCQTRVIGHGVQDGDLIFCCANCARQQGHKAVDRIKDDQAVLT